jgi:hypothetical protein
MGYLLTPRISILRGSQRLLKWPSVKSTPIEVPGTGQKAAKVFEGAESIEMAVLRLVGIK